MCVTRQIVRPNLSKVCNNNRCAHFHAHISRFHFLRNASGWRFYRKIQITGVAKQLDIARRDTECRIIEECDLTIGVAHRAQPFKHVRNTSCEFLSQIIPAKGMREVN
ncbi:hypothetical protein ASS64_03515 [Erythrobacter sp. AP23]|nr:hypothetical protein ASS64_03515 [Erythrobacter sp. AP23]